MAKFILVPDSYKGTMTSMQVCDAMKRGITRVLPDADIISIPVADGGEGSVDAFINAMGGERISVEVAGPYFDKMTACYGLLSDGFTAVIEVASCAGLPLVYNKKDPSLTTTFGVGEIMLDAVKCGCKRIIMCLGGSCTNDAGCGAAAAAGVRFLNASGEEFIPVGGTLSEIASIDAAALNTAFHNIEIISMCDVDNPLYGSKGAAFVFAPQKGADPEMIERLDAGLRSLASVSGRSSLAQSRGSGAAGGMGFGMQAFFGSKLKMGIDTVLDIADFDLQLANADYVFTGEGRIDPQSMHGKVVIGVAKRAERAGIPVIAVVGDISDGIDQAYELGVTSVFSINRVAVEKAEARRRAPVDLENTAADITRLIVAAKARR